MVLSDESIDEETNWGGSDSGESVDAGENLPHQAVETPAEMIATVASDDAESTDSSSASSSDSEDDDDEDLPRPAGETSVLPGPAEVIATIVDGAAESADSSSASSSDSDDETTSSDDDGSDVEKSQASSDGVPVGVETVLISVRCGGHVPPVVNDDGFSGSNVATDQIIGVDHGGAVIPSGVDHADDIPMEGVVDDLPEGEMNEINHDILVCDLVDDFSELGGRSPVVRGVQVLENIQIVPPLVPNGGSEESGSDESDIDSYLNLSDDMVARKDQLREAIVGQSGPSDGSKSPKPSCSYHRSPPHVVADLSDALPLQQGVRPPIRLLEAQGRLRRAEKRYLQCPNPKIRNMARKSCLRLAQLLGYVGYQLPVKSGRPLLQSAIVRIGKKKFPE